MSTIPPNWLASVIQSQGAQDQAAGVKKRERADEAERAGSFSERLLDVIENTDRDSQVYADAEGSGSQGRPCSEESEPEHDSEPSSAEEAPGGLDVQA